ncbi:MAG: hypothetical protein CMJ64_14435 [Planctomycetaceae bacterium]|nr:hypothetical protein [Planctomycetaceae bacterium]
MAWPNAPSKVRPVAVWHSFTVAVSLLHVSPRRDSCDLEGDDLSSLSFATDFRREIGGFLQAMERESGDKSPHSA